MNDIAAIADRLEAALARAEDRLATVVAERDAARTELEAVPEPDTGALEEAEARVIEAQARADAAEAAQAEAEDRVAALEAQVAAMESQSPDPDALAELESQLSEVTAERDAAQEAQATLQGQLDRMRAGDGLMAQQARGEAEALQAALTRNETALAELQRVTGQLRTNNAALRGALETGLSDPGLVDASLKVDLDALEAARAADRAELDSVLAALAPALKEMDDA